MSQVVKREKRNKGTVSAEIRNAFGLGVQQGIACSPVLRAMLKPMVVFCISFLLLL